MAASVARREPDQVPAQVKLDLLLVGDVTIQRLADTVRKVFSRVAAVSVTVSDMAEAVALLREGTFSVVFLWMALPGIQGPEVGRLIRFGKKKNTDLLFVSIIPENFKGHEADIILTEPLTLEKLSVVVKYWKKYFSNTVEDSPVKTEPRGEPPQRACSEHLGFSSTDRFACSDSLRNDLRLESKPPLSDFKTSEEISLLHSSKEKLRRERMRHCCEQLRALVPRGKGRKNDVASVLEATVEYVKYVRERIPPAAMGQITEVLQSNRKFCKKQQTPTRYSLPGTAMAQRETSAVATMHSPGSGIGLLANACRNVRSVPASGGSWDGAARGQPGARSERAPGDVSEARAPGPALPLRSFRAVHFCSPVIPPRDAAARTEHVPPVVPRVSKLLPQHCGSGLGQTCPVHPNCLQQFWAYK